MKSFISFSFVLLLFAALVGCQKEVELKPVTDTTTFTNKLSEPTTNPSVSAALYSYSTSGACGAGISMTCGTFNGGLKSTLYYNGGNNFVLRIQKCSGNFTQNGTAYVKTNGLCGTIAGSQTGVSYLANAPYVDVAFQATGALASISGTTVNFYGMTIGSSGSRSNSQSVYVTRN